MKLCHLHKKLKINYLFLNYYDLAFCKKLNKDISSDILSKGFHSKLETEAYLQYKKFENTKRRYENHGARNLLDVELSQHVFWNLAQEEIIKIIGDHYGTPFEVIK